MIEDLVRAILKLSPGVKRINADLAFMRQLLKPMTDQIIPWESEHELELLSLKHEIKSQKQGLDKVLSGSLYSIYYEPMVVFAYKDYIKGSREALLCTRTRNNEFIFRIKKRDVDVYLNGNQVAVIDQNNVMISLRSKEVLARIKPYSNDLLAVMIRNKDVGHLFDPSRPHSPQQRAFTLIQDLVEEEERILLAVSLFELVTRLLSNKKSK
ncbi:MAG: hypothetical protein M3R25_13845 [Bacteroidota bacterium]|nr:hypothetical protein [Bacteroidota bacterium]